MNTPVSDFIEKYNTDSAVRLHVPGHKGKAMGLSEERDITEIEGADVLYHETGILGESQKNASQLFGAEKTLYSAEGSSLSIRAMTALIKMYAESRNRKCVILAARNAHKVFMTVTALLGIRVKWLYPENEAVISAGITPEALRCFLKNAEEIPTALYVTSPDYLGNISDIKALSEICREYDILLTVDNAHGAYLHFLEEDIHPITLGAHMCTDSAHKTLPVLTGGGYLHISKKAPDIIKESAEKMMALFASTSPSYLILASLDRANRYISDSIREDLRGLLVKLVALRGKLSCKGYKLYGDEKLKITIDTKKYGYKGTEISDILRKNGIECEFSDPDFVVLMFTPFISEKELLHTENVLLSIPKKEPVNEEIPFAVKCERVFSVNDALFMPSERVKTEEAKGRILASPSVTCPPAVPIAVCGERLSEEAVRSFMYYGIEEIDVLKEV